MSQQVVVQRVSSTVLEVEDLADVVRRWPDEAARVWTYEAVASSSRKEAVEAIVATGSSVRDSDNSIRGRNRRSKLAVLHK